MQALTLNSLTSSYDMDDNSQLLALVYRIYYRVLRTTLNPKTILKSSRNKTLLIQSSTPDANIENTFLFQVNGLWNMKFPCQGFT